MGILDLLGGSNRAQLPPSPTLSVLDLLRGGSGVAGLAGGDFIAAMTAKHQAEQRANRQRAAYLANMPQGTGAIENRPPSRSSKIADYVARGAELLGAPKGTRGDLARYAETAADMTLPGTLDQLDRGDLEGAAMSMAGGPAAKGIRAFHGSPHSFDKFSMDKIGTGEGAQAYGHGLYFAENEGVAKAYRDDLTAMRVGKAQRALERAGGDIDTAIAQINDKITNLKGLPNAGNDPEKQARFIQYNEETLAELNALKRGGGMSSGSMYEVNIDADPEQFLDWDKPLTMDSPQKMKDAFNSIANSDPEIKDAFHRGFREQQPGWYYHALLSDRAKTGDLVKNQTAATEALKQAGIPGIKYLDAGSRGAADGSRNYVVFDDKLISIVKKYGITAAIGAGLITEEMARQMQAQGEI